jgi:hypothetical protein
MLKASLRAEISSITPIAKQLRPLARDAKLPLMLKNFYLTSKVQ